MPERFIGGDTPESIFNMSQAIRSGMPNYSSTGLTGLTGGQTTQQAGADLFGGGIAGVEGLTNFINQLNRTAQSQALGARIPQGTELETQSSQNIGSELRGEVPSDVLTLLGQQAAERGVGTGLVGSPASNASYLRALGLTSLGLQRQGQSDLSAALGRNPAAPLFDPSTQFLTPYQIAALQARNQTTSGGSFPMVPATTTRGGGGYTITPGAGGGGGSVISGSPATGTSSGPGLTAADLFGWMGGYGSPGTTLDNFGGEPVTVGQAVQDQQLLAALSGGEQGNIPNYEGLAYAPTPSGESDITY